MKFCHNHPMESRFRLKHPSYGMAVKFCCLLPILLWFDPIIADSCTGTIDCGPPYYETRNAQPFLMDRLVNFAKSMIGGK
jgi:hypothetical protein